MSESPNHFDDQTQSEQTAKPVDNQADSAQQPEPNDEAATNDSAKRVRRVLIGSQRDAAALHQNKKRDWYVPGQEQKAMEKDSGEKDPDTEKPVETPVAVEAALQPTPAAEETPVPEPVEEPQAIEPVAESASTDMGDDFGTDLDIDLSATVATPPGRHFPPPNIRGKLSPELEVELSLALGDSSIDDLMAGSDSITNQPLLEPESRHTGRVVAVQRDDVFVELGAREQGIVPLKLFRGTARGGLGTEGHRHAFQPSRRRLRPTWSPTPLPTSAIGRT